MIIANIFARAAELGKSIRHTPRLHEVLLDEKKLTLGELRDLSNEPQMSGRELLSDHQIGMLASIDLKDMDRQIEILKGALKNGEEKEEKN